jgi:NAD(P)-dependent dehydrogenase (short-subunit alcohol dehydrogenase family)
MTAPVFAVLGATGGIGAALCRQLAPTSRLLLGARSQPALEALAAELGAPWATVDATSGDAVDAFLQRALDTHGQLDGVVCAVGSILLKPAHLTTDDDWRRTLAQNLDAAFFTVRAAARKMKAGGSVVLFSTAAARTGLPNHEAIAAAKAGVAGLARSAAATYAPRGLRFNVIAPGLVDTPLAAHLTGNPRAREASERLHPLGRIGTADEVARLAAFLLDPANSWITGQEIGVDGGLATARPQPRP